MKFVNGRFQFDFEDFERRIGPDTNAFILCNPQNPTGNMWSADDLMRIGEICLKQRVLVLADEIHCDFATKGQKYTPFATLPNKAVVNNSVTFKAASKSFGLAAMKCAWFFSDNMDLITRIRPNNRADLTTLGMIASKAAYTRRRGLAESVRRVHRRQPRLRAEVHQRQHPDGEGRRQAAGHLPDVARRRRQVAEKIGAKAAGRRSQQGKAGGRGPRLSPSRWSSAGS